MPARKVPAEAAGLSPQSASPRAPIGALGLSAFGALMGGLFPISVIFSLGDIGGGLSASADDTAWLVTVYNVGQILGQPLLMITAGAFGRGVAMRVAGAGFVISSLAVAFAPDLGWAIGARTVQGIFGGVLPTFMMLLVMTSPLKGRAQVAGLAVFSLASSIGLGLAAAVAAWLIGIGGWRALFWGQALFGLLYTALAFLVLPGERGDPKRLRAADWGGYGLLSLALCLLLIGVSEGERRFWFDAWWITAALACGALGLVLVLKLIPQASTPLLRLDVIAKPTLGWALIFQLFFRFGLMFGIVVAPQYLARLQGYRVEQLGPLLLPLAAATLVAGPVAWWTVCRFDPRLSLSLGLASFAAAAARAAFLSSDWAGPELLGLLVLIGVGQAFVGVALLRFATFEVHPPTQGPTVGVAFNYARVLGLAAGVAAASHTLIEREKFHSARLGESLNLLDGDVSQRLAAQAGAFANWISDPAAAQRASVASLARAASGQAFAQGFADAFAVIAVGLLLAAILVWALPRLPAVPPVSEKDFAMSAPKQPPPSASPRDAPPEPPPAAPPAPPAAAPPPPPTPHQGTGRRVAVATASVAVLGIAVAAGYGLWHRVSPFEATDNAYVRGDLTFVAAKVPGYVVEVATENNRRVAPGQVLARIDPRDYQAAVADAEATLAQQKAAALQIDAQFQLQLAQIQVAEATVTAANAQAARARSDFARAKDLVADGAVSRSIYEQATAEDVRAGSGVTQSLAQTTFARRQLAVLDAQRQANRAAQQGAEAKLFKARNDLDSTVITAPREGLVAARNVRLGEYVGVGTRLMAVAPTRALWIEANLRETQLSRIRAGDRVQIRVDAANDQVFCGTVESLSAASGSEFSVIPPDNATGNFTKIVRRFPVRILFDARQPGLDRLGSGMSVEPRIAIGSHVSGKASGLTALFGGFRCATGGDHA